MATVINWREMSKEKPEDGQDCLTLSTTWDCLIEGEYVAETDSFEGLMGDVGSWWAYKWVPIEEVDP